MSPPRHHKLLHLTKPPIPYPNHETTPPTDKIEASISATKDNTTNVCVGETEKDDSTH
jgi:hypothetical protein